MSFSTQKIQSDELIDLYANGSTREELKINETIVDNPMRIPSESNVGSKSAETIHEASSQGHKEVVQLLLEKKADTEVNDKYGWTPLLYAARDGHKEVVQLLLENNADIEAKSSNGRIPLVFAAEKGHKEVVQLLLDNKANIEAKDMDGRTSLMWAARNGHKDVAQLLLENEADIEAKDEDGETPLIFAAWKGQKEVVQLLLENGADIEAKSSKGKTSLMYAAKYGQKEVVQLLLENKADMEAKDSGGQTALELCDSVMSEFIRCLPTVIEMTVEAIMMNYIPSLNPTQQLCDDVVPVFSQVTIENHYKQLQSSIAKAHAGLIFQNLFATTVKTTETILTTEWDELKLQFPLEKDDFVVETVSAVTIKRLLRNEGKHFFLSFWPMSHKKFLQLKSYFFWSLTFKAIQDALGQNKAYVLLYISICPFFLLIDIILKPLYILTTESWVDLECVVFRSDEKKTFVRPYLVKCPYVSSPLFISLLRFVDMNTTDDKNLFAFDFVKVSI